MSVYQFHNHRTTEAVLGVGRPAPGSVRGPGDAAGGIAVWRHRCAFPPPTPTLGCSPRFFATCRIPLSLRPRWFLLQCRAPVPSFPRGRFSAAAAGSSAGSRPPAGSARPVGLRGALDLHAVAGTEGRRGLVCGDDCVSGRGRVSWRFAEPGVRTAVTRGHACLLWVPF